MAAGDYLTALAILVGAALVAIQLHLQRRWNRQKSTEEICNRFIEPEMYKHWNTIQLSVVQKHKTWDDITEDEQASVRMLLSYFETIGILVRHRVVDRQMIADLFGDVIALLDSCTRQFLPRLRAERKSEAVYSEFSYLARNCGKRRE